MPSTNNRNAHLSEAANIYSESPQRSPPVSSMEGLFDSSSLFNQPTTTEHEVEERGSDDDEDETFGHSVRVRGESPPETVDEYTATLESSGTLSSTVRPFVRQDSDMSGHTRSPILARDATMLESFSRTVRNFVPSSISIPTAAPSPPRVSRPLSFGSFLTPSGAMTAVNREHHGYENLGAGLHRDSGRSTGVPRRGREDREPGLPVEPGFSPADEDDDPLSREQASYPRAGAGDSICWAGWDALFAKSSDPRRLLFLGYRHGLQIWDCTGLGSVSEILNLNGSQWGHVSFAGVLPFAGSRIRKTDATDDQPLIGFISHYRDESSFVVYSLHRHHIVKKLSFRGLVSFQATENFLVISTSNPAALHIISPVTFLTLHTISSSSLVTSIDTNVLPMNLESESDLMSPQGRPVFALSNRLLAYASPPPHPDSPNLTAAQPRVRLSGPSTGALSSAQADISNAALKVGSSVLSGVKALGGIAISAAMSRAGLTEPESAVGRTASGLSSRFFSRSAPAASGRERPYSATSVTSGSLETQESGLLHERATAIVPRTAVPAGYYVTVLDLRRLMDHSTGGKPATVSEFLALKHQPISHLMFSKDGTQIIISPRDGQVLHVFQIRTSPIILTGISDLTLFARHKQKAVQEESFNSIYAKPDIPWHLYDLRRGRTSVIVEQIDWAADGKWIAVGTRNQTIHVFPVNPYGGIPDHRSHMEGRVRNSHELQPLSTDISPIVRLRAQRSSVSAERKGSLAFTFIKSSESSLTSTLLPRGTHTSRPSSISSDANLSEPHSPNHMHRPSSFQDILVFDPADGYLSLRRITLELKHRDHGLFIPKSVSLGATSTSLPKMTGAGRLSVSPTSPKPVHRTLATASVSTETSDSGLEMSGHESVVANWSLQRRPNWPELRHIVVEETKSSGPPRDRPRKSNWLSQAELSTFSRSARVLPRSIYLAHQFSFQTLGEDYHALIRRHQLEINGSKIEVRREVEVSAYSAGIGESFVEGYPVPDELRRGISGSFDEPLASALGGGMDYAEPSVTIPMLPNGTPGSKTTSFRNAIPIRTMAGLSDGMSEGIGRLRREIHKTRSPPSLARSDSRMSGPVPLEFEEEDEDFADEILLAEPSISQATPESRVNAGLAASISIPASSHAPEEDEFWQGQGWDPQDRQAIEDAERFDDISAVGFLDEEHATMAQAEKRKGKAKKRRG